jgi:hypothetical protein
MVNQRLSEDSPMIATPAAMMMNIARLSNLDDNQTVNQMERLASVFGGTVNLYMLLRWLALVEQP